MKTYQDLEELRDDESARAHFVVTAVNEFKMAKKYQEALAGEQYFGKHNSTIEAYQKKLRTISGREVDDIFSSNYKIKSLIYNRLVTQQVQYVLGNGLVMKTAAKKKKLGKNFDFQLMKLAIKSMNAGEAYGFWNLDHMEVFGYAETPEDPGFCPLYDTESGEMRAGIRFWNRVIGDEFISYYTLYEEDGYSNYKKAGQNRENKLVSEKRAYKNTIRSTVAVGVMEVIGENYSRLPIIPLYPNLQHQSELTGIREAIDCYDLVKSGFANDVDDSSGFYWVLKNAGGMDDVDIAQFIQRIKSARGASVDDGVEVSAETYEVPVTARETLLDRLEKDIYKDFQALDVSSLSAAQKTAQEIQAAYQPMDNKAAFFEYFLMDFMDHIFELAGMPGEEATFRWNKITNEAERTGMILNAANYLPQKLLIKLLPFLTPEEALEAENGLEEEGYAAFNIPKADEDEKADSEEDENAGEDEE